MFQNTEKQYICKFILWFKVYVLVRENQDMHMGETRLVHAFNIKDTSNIQVLDRIYICTIEDIAHST